MPSVSSSFQSNGKQCLKVREFLHGEIGYETSLLKLKKVREIGKKHIEALQAAKGVSLVGIEWNMS